MIPKNSIKFEKYLNVDKLNEYIYIYIYIYVIM